MIIIYLTLLFGIAHAQYDYPNDKVVFIQKQTLAHCMLLIADKYPEAKKYPSSKSHLKPFKNRPCLPQDDTDLHWHKYLAVHENRFCDFATGHEETLKKWILNQKDNSIDPLNIFEKAMELNQGNLISSLITIHQLLRNNARWYSKQFYDYHSTKEEARVFWNKFVDIRGDLTERGPKFEGDHAGSWYRFWGMAIWRTRKSYLPIGREYCATESSETIQDGFIRDVQAITMSYGAEALKYLIAFGDSPYRPQLKDLQGKAKMNAVGAELGQSFATYLSDGILNVDPQYRKKTFEKICREKRFFLYGR